MSTLIDTLREIIRHELAARRPPELALVTAVFPGDGADGNHAADLRLRESGLTLRRVPVAVPRPGLSLLPRPGDAVIVAFLGGDLAQPVVLGSIYTAAGQPPEAGPLEAVWKPGDAEDGAVRRLHLETPSGGVVTLDDATLTVTLGGTELVIAQDGDVTIRAAGAISLSADGDIAIEAGGKLTLKAGSDAALEAQASLGLKANAAATLEAAGSATVKAASLTFAGSTSFSPG